MVEFTEDKCIVCGITLPLCELTDGACGNCAQYVPYPDAVSPEPTESELNQILGTEGGYTDAEYNASH